MIDTALMEWRYDVRGTLPRYHAPTAAASRIDTKLRDDTQQAHAHATTRRTDFVKRNQQQAAAATGMAGFSGPPVSQRRMPQARAQQRMVPR